MRIRGPLLLLLATLALAGPAGAQTAVAAADLTALDASVGVARQQLTPIAKGDASLGAALEKELNDVVDDITYLRVKLRREGSVTREEYTGVRDRLDVLRSKLQGTTVEGRPVEGDPLGASVRIPVGAQLDLRLRELVSSRLAKIDDRFEATTTVDYPPTGVPLIPAGSIVRGFISSVRTSGRVDRIGSVTLSFDEVRMGDRAPRLRASVIQVFEGRSTSDDAFALGVGAAMGSAMDSLSAGGKGAMVGALVAGGTIAATDGGDVTLPAGTIVRIRVTQPIAVAIDN